MYKNFFLQLILEILIFIYKIVLKSPKINYIWKVSWLKVNGLK